ncbi:uncharacterized protein SPPG_02628 [Spizellomyces punctatus DAOM BR117]|uniref:Uncharacterized protein n=1 Tax=Spizellomyces punctatus (strain DAOM BR117) TaxID=645134 RepID=A0A0L0HMV9_SPIPD|nr:uncharacterized protein SPPG_02628 [Spizellomyces punctatus DAOM BR117]KND02134.1 hypothetical protein SPPG_02628 [Spizellomyces punctatus DAOM BR117]|eukprot:XP_016610173.1 hypothetical protein SPPG_02628 [Spizellomyces punctatus DAOM BR117]
MSNTDLDTKLMMEKFNGMNYHLWKFKMTMLLKEKGLWGVIEGDQSMEGTSEKDWRRKDERAMAVIALSLSDAQLMHVQTAVTAKVLKLSAWNTDFPCRNHF